MCRSSTPGVEGREADEVASLAIMDPVLVVSCGSVLSKQAQASVMGHDDTHGQATAFEA